MLVGVGCMDDTKENPAGTVPQKSNLQKLARMTDILARAFSSWVIVCVNVAIIALCIFISSRDGRALMPDLSLTPHPHLIFASYTR